MASTFGIKVYQYDTNGNFVAEYQSVNEAQDLTGINNISVSANNKKNMCSAGGYIWTFKYYIKLPQNIIDKYDDRNFQRFNVPIYKYDIEGNFIEEYTSLSKITKIRADRNCVRSVLKGETKTFKNHIYLFKKYKKLPKSIMKDYFKLWKGFVLQYDLKGNFIKEWKTSYLAAKELKLSRTNINRCLRKEKPQASGFIWKYK
jgi:hypothetical protein